MKNANDTIANTSRNIRFSVLVPMFNEAEMILPLFQRLTTILSSISESSEIIIVDDGSQDGTWDLLQRLPNTHIESQFIRLSRNFGKEAAMSAGLEYCKSDAVIMLDADLQDPPELIPEMLQTWQSGFDIVNMKRSSRKGESWFKRFTANGFYRVINWLSDADIPENVGDFRLISRTVIDAINKLPERNRFMKGIFNWPGFQTTTLTFERDPRHTGNTKWNYSKLCTLAMDGITSVSFKPLRLSTWIGSSFFLFGLIYGIWNSFNYFVLNESINEYFPFMLMQLIFVGIQLLALGLIGEYLGRVFVEVKQRPLYLIEEVRLQQKDSSLDKLD